MSSNNKPKILFISHDAGNLGAQISLSLLMREFRSLIGCSCRTIVRSGKRGKLWEVFSQYGPTIMFYENDFQYFSVKKSTQGGAAYFLMQSVFWLKNKVVQKLKDRNIRKNILKWDPDLIYSNTAMNGDVINKLNIKVPVVVHVRELNTFLDTLDKNRTKALINKTNLFFAASEEVKNNLIKRYSIPATKIFIAHAAICTEDVIKKSSAIPKGTLKKNLGIQSDALIVGSVGRLDKRKGSDIFLDVCKIIETHSDLPSKVVFLWVGWGPDLNDVKNAFQAAGLADKLFLVGKQDNPYPYFNMLDIFLMTSREDPFPRVNLEAGILEKPVVCFGESGGSKEFVEDDCGIVIPKINADQMASGVVRLLEDKKLRHIYGKQARKKVLTNYDVQIVAKKVIHDINRELKLELDVSK